MWSAEKEAERQGLQERCQSVNLRGMNYTKNEKGDKCQILKNSEFLVAQLLLAEGRTSAVPVGWSQAAPTGTPYLDINPAMPVQAAAPQPLVYDMPSAPPA